MGCDIHIHVEVLDYVYDPKTKGEHEKWVMVIDRPATYTRRDYGLFGVLAGVRVDVPPIVPPRGIPKDASREVKARARRDGSDGHTHSWLTVAEIRAYDWANAPHQAGREFIPWLDSIRTGPTWLGGSIYPDTKVRLVFWFDN